MTAPIVFVPSTAAPTHLGRFREPIFPTLGPFCFYNNAEGGTDAGGVGTTVTVGNSGGRSGAPADTVTIGASASLIFDNTHVAHGSYAYRFATGASAVQSNLRWEQPTLLIPRPAIFWRVNVYFSAFTNSPSLSRIQPSSGDVGRVTFNTSGNVIIRDASTAIVATSTNAVATNTGYRLEGYQAVGTNALAKVRIYPGFDTPIDQYIEELSINANFGTALIEQFAVGQISAVANIPQWWADDIGVCDTDWLGPVGPDMAPQAKRLRRTPAVRYSHITRAQTPLLPQDLPVAPPTPRRRGTVPRHRPDTFEPPWQIAATPPPFVPLPLKDRAKALRRRQPEIVTPIIDQTVPPALTPTPTRVRAWLRRWRGTVPVRAQVNPPYPPQGITASAKVLRRPRRQLVASPPAAIQDVPPQGITATARVLRRIRRLTVFPVPGQTTPPAPQPVGTRSRLRLRSRGRIATVAVPQDNPIAFARARVSTRALARGRRWWRLFTPPETLTRLASTVRVRLRALLRVKPRIAEPPLTVETPLTAPPYVPPPVRQWMRESQLARPRIVMPVQTPPIVIPPDTIFEPLLDVALQCLCDAVAQLPVPPDQCCHRPGDHVTFDQTECCQGLSWVRFVSAVPTDEENFPGARTEIESCELPVREWSVEVELGIARCAPVGTVDLLPTCAEWIAAQQTGLLDLMALRIATCCIGDDFRYRDLVIGELAVHGPAGGCSDTTMTIQVKVVGCDECS